MREARAAVPAELGGFVLLLWSTALLLLCCAGAAVDSRPWDKYWWRAVADQACAEHQAGDTPLLSSCPRPTAMRWREGGESSRTWLCFVLLESRRNNKLAPQPPKRNATQQATESRSCGAEGACRQTLGTRGGLATARTSRNTLL